MTSKCCGYGNAASDTTKGFDCVLIPGATKFATTGGAVQTIAGGAGNGFCGGELGTIQSSIAAATVCCNKPLILLILSICDYKLPCPNTLYDENIFLIYSGSNTFLYSFCK